MSWRITFLGSVSATREGKALTRFESSRAIALLARLALFPRRTHPREELIELLWPEVEREVAQVRLRHTLRTLRQPLELGLPAGSVLIADRLSVRINPDAITTDVAQFEQALKHKDLATARTLYTGELLPGLYDDWIIEERYRLEALAEILLPSVLSTPSSGEVRADREEGRRGTSRGDGPKGRGDGLSFPPYLTAFFGREAEREAITEQLTRSRLVTLTGLGGTGKTRLSVEILRSTGSTFAISAFVGLGECIVAGQIPGRIRDVLGLPAVSADPLEQVAWALTDAPALLILDNFEQLVDSGGAELVEVLLARLPQLTLLVTSRRALGIAGERLFPLESLSTEASQALFLDRVQATRPGFHLTEGNRADVLAVCQGLEGIPLALELAAARIRAFSVSEMRQELQTRFEWLARTGLRGDKDDRHRSLAAALDWSWRLLPGSQQRFLANLALFRAPFSAADAAAVTGYPDARERLEALVTDSLVQSASDKVSGQTRYSMLETVREFAVSRLSDGSEARVLFRKHYLTRSHRDQNTVTAWRYALEDDDGESAHAFVPHLAFNVTGLLGTQARDMLERTLALPCTDPRLRMLAAHRLAETFLRANERTKALSLMDEIAAALEDAGAPDALLAETLSCQAHIGLFDAPKEKTFALIERCLCLTTDSFIRAETLGMKGGLLCQTPDFEDAEAIFDEAQQLYALDDSGQRHLYIHRGLLERRRKNYEEALRLYQTATELAQRAEDPMTYKFAQSNAVEILGFLGRWDEAIQAGLACLDMEEILGDRHNLILVLWNLALPFLELGEPERAARLIAAASATWMREVRPLTDEDADEIEDIRAKLAIRLDEATLTKLWAEGEALTLKEALALARTTP
ncbi:NB-ARC domain-containing protein [Armatimonas sp.]|uniref:ATP-binding protein n=1 Tax=Armatimonas sp. TaxID=1872638 RepID=UPI00286A988F|nr:NB-ARC domain-containing protein [Armatimonas sp.]